MIDDMNHKEYLLQKYEMKIYHYEKYLLKKGHLESEARQLLQQFRLEQPLSDQKVSNAVSDNYNLRNQVSQLQSELTKIKDVREKDKKTISDLNNTIENMIKKQNGGIRRSMTTTNQANNVVTESDFFQSHQLKMLPSLRLSVIGEDGVFLAADDEFDKRRESIINVGRRDTIQEIVQSFN